jgi:hypothetical protein
VTWEAGGQLIRELESALPELPILDIHFGNGSASA